ncbi:MAG: Gfo/Idh/MocA family oxidoreductase [Burkholderiales bacterium]|nr:Gfo/Idh/MocA family oxidoreductase [Burkholderiales bacterium]
MTALDVVMVGCGAFAHRYHVPALREDAGVRIAAIFDPKPSAATRALADAYAAPLTDRLEALPALRSPAFAIVSTPHTLHAVHVETVLDRDLDVLVDKPFVMHAADARRLAARADAQRRVNGVAYNRRFDAGCLRARAIVAAGGIGEVRFVQTVQLGYERAGWFLVPELGGGGPYTGRASHMADIVPWLIGRRPTRLRSRLRTSDPARSDHGGFIELAFGDLECQMTCIEEGWHMWDEIRIFGDDGLVELRRPLTAPIGWSLAWHRSRDGRVDTMAADTTPGGATRDFMRAVRERSRPACTFADAVASVEIVELAFESARRDGEWLSLADSIAG